MSYLPSKSALDYKITDNNGKKVHTLTWSIPRFLSITNCKYIRAYETQYDDNIKEKQFKIRVKFCGTENNIKIYFLYTENAALNIQFDLIEMYSRNQINTKTVMKNKWTHFYTMKSMNKQRINCCNESGLLKMSFKFTISSILSEPLVELEPEHQLLNNLNYLRSLSSDVILKSEEGFEFKAHKHILSRCSTVLKAHFEHNTLENNLNIVESHLGTEVLNEVLTYIYTDRAPRVQEMANILLAAADFYHLPGLKNISAEILYLKLTTENTIATLQLADLYSEPHLTKLTLEFIKNGNAALITKTDAWKSIKSVDIIKTIYECIANMNVKSHEVSNIPIGIEIDDDYDYYYNDYDNSDSD